MGRNASAEQSRLQKSTDSRSRSQSRHKPRACYILLLFFPGGKPKLPGRGRRRSRTSWTDSDKDDLLKAIGDCRAACIRARGISLLSKKDVYGGCHAVMASIDELARILTGDPTHFHLKMHTAHPRASD